ncbi:hypothetical protein [Moorena sp. SIO4G3]|uniref:hypothetical protein n=1 Tax=Moorena sp. SIO4G3 TaxID=2607821 RepID=UPI00142A168B|nr:hypothetical protein [Moorena sp. SIO4G3]NEO78508.1 hypothetical protein [Moorena sp. SIO4G3]
MRYAHATRTAVSRELKAHACAFSRQPSAKCLHSRLPIPYSLLPTPDSRLPIPDSRFPIPYSLLPTPLKTLYLDHDSFPISLLFPGQDD